MNRHRVVEVFLVAPMRTAPQTLQHLVAPRAPRRAGDDALLGTAVTSFISQRPLAVVSA